MRKVCVVTDVGTPSFSSVAKYIADEFKIDIIDVKNMEKVKEYDKVLFFWWYHDTAFRYLSTLLKYNDNVIFYFTIEHIPYIHRKFSEMLDNVKKIAVSKLWLSIVKTYGVEIRNVVDVIPHFVPSNFTVDTRQYSVFHVRLCTVTSSSPRKGVENIIKLARMLKKSGVHFTWYVICSDDAFPLLYHYYCYNIKAINRLPTLNYKQLLKNIDIYVCTSYTEGFGLPLLEASLSKCVVVAPSLPTVIEYNLADVIVPTTEPHLVYDVRHMVHYIMFDYDVNDMFNAILEAIQIIREDIGRVWNRTLKLCQLIAEVKRRLARWLR